MAHPVARLAGALLSVAALLWLALEARARWDDLNPSILSSETAVIAILGSLGLGAAYWLQGLNWRDLVRLFARDTALPSAPLVGSAMTTQIAKYLPGNVAHLAGRHLQAAGTGVSNTALGKALASEIAVLVASAGLIALAALSLAPGSLQFEGWSLQTPAVVALVGLVLVGFVVARKAGRLSRVLPKLVLRAGLWIFVFGLVFWAILVTIHPVSLGSAMAAASIGWAIGFATPGSPGGIGTREGAMTLLLSPTVPLDALIPALALFRLVTVLADLVCFALGRMIRKSGW